MPFQLLVITIQELEWWTNSDVVYLVRKHGSRLFTVATFYSVLLTFSIHCWHNSISIVADSLVYALKVRRPAVYNNSLFVQTW